MSTIDDFLTELQSAIEFENARISGYNEILAIPLNLLTVEAKEEVHEALNWSIERFNKLTDAFSKTTDLKLNGYPARIQQIAPAEVIKELEKALNNFKLAVSEFQTLEGHVEVSEELSI